MAMTRTQLRQAAAIARYQADKKKPATRKQIQQWLKPIRSAFSEMMTGEVDAIRGYAVTRLHTGDDYARIDYCINGFTGMLDRLIPDFDIGAMKLVSRKLAAGTPLTLDEVKACMVTLDDCENRMMKLTRQQLMDAAMAEQINIEIEQLGLRKAA